MSLDLLTTHSAESNSSSEHVIASKRRSLAWLLPLGLAVGFTLIILLLFGKKLIPATDVQTAPVITLRLGNDKLSDVTTEPDQAKEVGKVNSIEKGQMIFQASGWIEPDPYITFVPTLINGVINTVHVLEGQEVKKGDLLATFIDDDMKINLAEAKQRIFSLEARIEAHCKGILITEAELKSAQQMIISQKSTLDTATDLQNRLHRLAVGDVSEQQIVQAELDTKQQAALLEEAKTNIPRLEARIEQINFERTAMESNVNELKTARDRAQLAMDRTRITAPMDGKILHLHAAPGKRRMLNMDIPKSSVIVEMYDPEKLQARIDVPLSEAAGLTIGQFVELSSDILPDLTLTGKVTRINGEADLQRNTLQAKVSIENPDPRLRPEMLLRAKFFSTDSTASPSARSTTSANSRLSIFVPAEAVINGESVWVVTDNQTSKFRNITITDEKREGHYRVLDGVLSGEEVILPPHTGLKDGTRLNITN